MRKLTPNEKRVFNLFDLKENIKGAEYLLYIMENKKINGNIYEVLSNEFNTTKRIIERNLRYLFNNSKLNRNSNIDNIIIVLNNLYINKEKKKNEKKM